MERAEVLIVGGGPAGSACAAELVRAGRDVLVVDAAAFPRDKPCAGWITPEVLEEIPFTIDEYAKGHVAQTITRFRVGRIGGRGVDVEYGAPVSYGIRRCEFDAELLRRSGARVLEGERIRTIERRNGEWVLNGKLAAPTLVGAGGHFCPVARHIGGPDDPSTVVAAREIEFRLPPDDARRCPVEEDRPELYFCRDMRGYGWCFRKEGWLNVGLGRLDSRHLNAHLGTFLENLHDSKRLGRLPDEGWRGHAYRIRQGPSRRPSAKGVVLVGDSAGLAAAASGEGILPARVSGRMAAEAILESRIPDYERRLEARFGRPAPGRELPGVLMRVAGAVLLSLPGIVRHLVLDRWFLHRQRTVPANP